jgi:hypothetical protein
MLRRIHESKPPAMDLDAYFGAKYEKILSRTQQAATFFADEAMIAYDHSFGPSKATFVSYMKTIIGHLDLSNDHSPLTDELADMPRELAQLVDPTQHLRVPLQPDWTTPAPRLHGSTTTCLFLFRGAMVDVKAWAGCMSSLT